MRCRNGIYGSFELSGWKLRRTGATSVRQVRQTGSKVRNAKGSWRMSSMEGILGRSFFINKVKYTFKGAVPCFRKTFVWGPITVEFGAVLMVSF